MGLSASQGTAHSEETDSDAPSLSVRRRRRRKPATQEIGGTFGRSYFWQRAARRKRFPQARQVPLHTQYLQQRELDNPYFPPATVGLRSWNEVLKRLKREHKGDVHVAVYPYAGLQHGPAVLDLPVGV